MGAMNHIGEFRSEQAAPEPWMVGSFIQRKCQCGSSSAMDDRCAECRSSQLSGMNKTRIATPPKEATDAPDNLSTGGNEAIRPAFGHDFSKMPILAEPTAGMHTRDMGNSPDFGELPTTEEDAPPEGVDLAQDAPSVATPLDTDAGVKPAPCCQVDSFTVSNDTYTDTDTDCRKNIEFDCTVKSGSDPHRCVMVNWIQGTAKNKDGTFRKVKMFDTIVDYNFPKSRIDSLDKDPVYASNSSGRWNYSVTGQTFSTTDSPGPTVWVDGIDYDLKFNMCVYCIDDVSATSDESGSGVKNPLQCYAWVFKAKYDAGAKKFTH